MDGSCGVGDFADVGHSSQSGNWRPPIKIGIHVTVAKEKVLYLPGVDGTGELLFQQQDLLQSYDVMCQKYPDDRSQTYESLADDAITRIEKDGEGHALTVLAESFGGAVALTLALKRPELVRRLLLVNTFAYYPYRLLIGLMRIGGRFLPPRPVFPGTRSIRGLFFFSSGTPKPLRDEWWSHTDEVSMQAYWIRMSLIAKLDLRDRLAEISCPSVVLCSTEDRIVDPNSGRELAALLPDSVLVERPLPHAAMLHASINIAEFLRDRELWPSLASDESLS